MNGRIYKILGALSFVISFVLWILLLVEASTPSTGEVTRFLFNLGGPHLPFASHEGLYYSTWTVAGLPFFAGTVFFTAGVAVSGIKELDESYVLTAIGIPILILVSILISAILSIPTALIYAVVSLPFIIAGLFGGGLGGWCCSGIIVVMAIGALFKEAPSIILIIFGR